ncbi:LpqB family beta-propeller domain-containing protein [Demequina lutea]|uniref:GerMN domain-containing protein n=1 Tax=Demequina lutea TaxID=431489 RepID=A0A7Z0CJJ0_9MICO|nr:LpqB family beta-propeller domain-containing protein [Demequina lutea]NYI40800.1 hypothetical protein [Demequina lutea]
MKRLIAATLACLALAACSAIPTSGPVEKGVTDVSAPNDFSPILPGPTPGATPTAIVQGFLTAASGGSVNGFDVAREYLTPAASSGWDPLAQVTVFDSREVFLGFDEAKRTATYKVPVAARVNADGVLVEASSDEQSTLEFTVTTDNDGNSRISGLDDGIVMSAADFARYYRPVKLLFVSKDNATLVPELRWFPSNDQIATATARELVKGPSPWLADAVNTGFPPGSSLNVDAVVVENGVAKVTLAAGSAGDAAQRSLAAEQLRLTLTQLPSVQEVVTTVGALPLAGDDSAAPKVAALPDERAAVIADGRLGMWNGDKVEVTPADVGVVPVGASGLALSYDAKRVAMVVNGSIVTSTALSDAHVLEAPPANPDAPGGPVVPTKTIVEGRNLVAPSFDLRGWLWTTETLSDGTITVAGPDGAVTQLAAPQLEGRTIQALAVSRDGARVAVLSRASGVQVLEVMAVVRGSAGEPLALGATLALGPAVPDSIDLAWLDDVSVAALGADSSRISVVAVGGWTTDVTAPVGAMSIAARNGVPTLLAVGEGDTLVARYGNDWKIQASNVSEVAFAG